MNALGNNCNELTREVELSAEQNGNEVSLAHSVSRDENWIKLFILFIKLRFERALLPFYRVIR
jgi:hypothetical protein